MTKYNGHSHCAICHELLLGGEGVFRERRGGWFCEQCDPGGHGQDAETWKAEIARQRRHQRARGGRRDPSWLRIGPGMMRVVMGRDGEVDGQHGDGDDHPDDYPPAT